MPNKTDAIKTLCKHAVSTLPQSIAQREVVLRAVAEALPNNSQIAQHVLEMLKLLERHDQLQSELPGLFTQNAQ